MAKDTSSYHSTEQSNPSIHIEISLDQSYREITCFITTRAHLRLVSIQPSKNLCSIEYARFHTLRSITNDEIPTKIQSLSAISISTAKKLMQHRIRSLPYS